MSTLSSKFSFSESCDTSKIKEVARYWEHLKQLNDSIDLELKKAALYLLEHGKTVFLDDGMKVAFTEATSIITLDETKLIEFFVQNDRWDDLLKVISINQSDLTKELTDGAAIIEDMKAKKFYELKPKAASLKLSEQTKKEKSENH